MISYRLRQAGAVVTLANNGREALDLAVVAWEEGFPYDLIFMDMQMPEMDGYTATSHLRDKGYKGPVIALTAHTMATDRAKCLACGCDDYSSKPINVPELLSLAERYIEQAADMWGETFDFVPYAQRKVGPGESEQGSRCPKRRAKSTMFQKTLSSASLPIPVYEGNHW